ncbi:hypothetical protein PAMP_009162 [Pampus punctatissimus]
MQVIRSAYPGRQVIYINRISGAPWIREEQMSPNDETIIQGSKRHIPGLPDLSKDMLSVSDEGAHPPARPMNTPALSSSQKLEVCVVHPVGVYSLWSEWRMSVVKSVQHGTRCGLKGCQCHGPASVPRDMHLCQPQMRRNPYGTLGRKLYSDHLSEKKESTESC